jgi:hypothetical protein
MAGEIASMAEIGKTHLGGECACKQGTAKYVWDQIKFAMG